MCNNSCGGFDCWWIIILILLFCCCGCGTTGSMNCGCGNGSCGRNGGNSCECC